MSSVLHLELDLPIYQVLGQYTEPLLWAFGATNKIQYYNMSMLVYNTLTPKILGYSLTTNLWPTQIDWHGNID